MCCRWRGRGAFRQGGACVPTGRVGVIIHHTGAASAHGDECAVMIPLPPRKEAKGPRYSWRLGGFTSLPVPSPCTERGDRGAWHQGKIAKSARGEKVP